jgi:hypothetical protein
MKSAKRRDGSTVETPSRLDSIEVRFEVEHYGQPVDVLEEQQTGRIGMLCQFVFIRCQLRMLTNVFLCPVLNATLTAVYPFLAHASTCLPVPDEAWPGNMRMRNQEGTLWILQPGLRLDLTASVANSGAGAAAVAAAAVASVSGEPSTPLKKDGGVSPRLVYRIDCKPGLTSNIGSSKLFRMGLVVCTSDLRYVLAWAFSPAFLVASSTLPDPESYEPELQRLNVGIYARRGFTSADFALPPTLPTLQALASQNTSVVSGAGTSTASAAAKPEAKSDDESMTVDASSSSSSSATANTPTTQATLEAATELSGLKKRGRKVCLN